VLQFVTWDAMVVMVDCKRSERTICKRGMYSIPQRVSFVRNKPRHNLSWDFRLRAVISSVNAAFEQSARIDRCDPGAYARKRKFVTR
jgi:hypothetical protein